MSMERMKLARRTTRIGKAHYRLAYWSIKEVLLTIGERNAYYYPYSHDLKTWHAYLAFSQPQGIRRALLTLFQERSIHSCIRDTQGLA